MASRGKAAPFLTLVLAALFVAGFPAARPARADSNPPFHVEFPQDSGVTHFSSTLGASRSGGRSHHGNDLMAPKLTPVYAAADGVISVIDSSSLGGRYVEIQHAAGWSTRYMHLNNDLPGTNNGKAPWFITVADGIYEGAEVKAGQLLGWVGDSGNAEGGPPHTHFELHRNGRAVNPYPYLRDALERALIKPQVHTIFTAYIR